MLRRALQVGRQQLHDEEEELAVDLEEDGSEPELDPIRVQLAYLAYQQGEAKEAAKSLLSVVSHGSSSKIIHAIATCNLVAVCGCNDQTDGIKREGRGVAARVD